MLAVVRHGDRTPKQKMKMKVTQVQAQLHTTGLAECSPKELACEKLACVLYQTVHIARLMLKFKTTAQ